MGELIYLIFSPQLIRIWSFATLSNAFTLFTIFKVIIICVCYLYHRRYHRHYQHYQHYHALPRSINGIKPSYHR